MVITSADVISLNGKLSKGIDADARSWASAEDGAYFDRLKSQHDVLVMGRNTYDVVRPRTEAGRLRVVLTHHPEAYQAKTIPGQLEFLNLSPQELVAVLKRRGCQRALLVGGQVNSQFWAAGLLDEAHVTFEPIIFPQGKDFLKDVNVEVKLRLVHVEQLNRQGSLVAHYLVEK